MRHFRSILYAIVLAPAVWVLVAVGLTHDLTARGRDGFAVESLTGLALLLLGGAAYGILVFAPISPLGPVVAGVVFLVTGVWAIESPTGYAGLWPSGVVKDGFDLSRPGYGLAALLSVPLILTVLSVRRWSGFEPVVLPIIGPVGRARGAAAVAGTPVAAMPTAVLTVSAADGFPADDGDERTTLIRMPGDDMTPEATTVLTRPAEDEDGESTDVLRAPAAEPATEDVAAGDEEPTEAVTAGDDEPTFAIPDERPTQDVLDEPPTEVMMVGNDASTEPIAAEDAVGSAAEELRVSGDDDEATAPSRPTEPSANEPETVDAEAGGDEPETVDAEAGGDEKTAVFVPTDAVAAVADEAPPADVDEPIDGLAAADPAETKAPQAETPETEAPETEAPETEAELAEAQADEAEAQPEETAEAKAEKEAEAEAESDTEAMEAESESAEAAAAEAEPTESAAAEADAEPAQAEMADTEAAEVEAADVEDVEPEVVSAEGSGGVVAPEAADGGKTDEASADDEPVTAVLAPAENDPPAEVESADDELVTAVRAVTEEQPADDEPATSVLNLADSDAAASGEEVGEEPARAESPTADDHRVDDEATVVALVASGLAPVDPDDSASDWVSAGADGDEDGVPVEETTDLLPPDDDDARTRASRLAAELAADGERTQVIRPVGYEPGQTTRDLGAPGERTQVIWPAAQRVPGEATQVIGLPGEKTRRIVRSGEKVAGLDETQVIRLPDPVDDGGRTQVIRLGQVTPPSNDAELTRAMPRVDATPPSEDQGDPARVTPPADGVEPVRIPHQRTDSDEDEEPTEPATPPSIARAESPNFAEDPTGRIVSPVLPPDEPTRTMTVMNIERPPDDPPQIPAQRKPAED